MKKYNCLNICIIALIIILCSSCKRDFSKYVIGLKQNIHHDDFEYSVSDYIVTRFLKNKNDTLHARGMFYLVTFRVENRAKRVDHNWDNSVAFIIDERGKTYENLKDVQQYYEKIHPFGLKETYTTLHGRSDSTVLAFDLPFNLTRPYLRVRGKILMGDALDGARFRKMLVKLY